MSDSGSESNSSEGYDGGRNRLDTVDEVTSSRYSHRSSGSEQRKSAASSITSGGKSPKSPLSDGESKSVKSAPLSPKSQRSEIMSPDRDGDPDGSPRSIRSLSKSPSPSSSLPMSPASPPGSPPASPPESPPGSPPASPPASPPGSPPGSPLASPPASPKSYRSGNNSLDSPRSDRSSYSSPGLRDNGSCLSPANGSKSTPFGDAESKASDIEMDTQRSADNSLKSYSYKNSESRQSSPKSPRSGPSSVKSLISARSSPKSFKSGPASPIDDQESDKNSGGPRSPEGGKNGSFNELDGEQISDGDIEDEPETISKSMPTPITHGEDLSDVSDLESMDGHEEFAEPNAEVSKKTQERDDKQEMTRDQENTTDKKEDKIAAVGLAEESEQLDFEADGQWKDERDDGEAEVSGAKENKEETDRDNKDKDNRIKSKELGQTNDKEEGEEGEKEESELEEGELSDGDDVRPEETEPRPVCRFYNRGQCTWGVSCRFLHPGVTDKGNYTMFDMVRPMAYPPHASAPHEYRSHVDRSNIRSMPGYGAPAPAPKVEETPTESAWERGLRHAKEMMRKANKRKESDMDFEEKKMNLSLGQDELDREAGYYVRPASPEPPVERWPEREVPRRIPPSSRLTPERYIDEPETYYPPPPSSSEYYRRVHYKEPREYRERVDYHAIPRGAHSVSPPLHNRERDRERDRERERERDYYEKYEKKHKRPSREVIVERIPPNKSWREEEPPPVERGRGDEWADPWMRRKSPSTVRRQASTHRSRRQSYSSASSYSSTSSSRSSSRSSYSSYDSLSRSRSPSPRSRTRSSGKNRSAVLTSPPSNTPVVATAPQRGAMLMNPPAPSPRPPKGSISPTTGTLHRRAGLNPPAPSPVSSHQRHHEKAREQKAAMAAAAVAKIIKSRSRSRSSHSSSGSESSGSSSDSSESSYSTSSSEARKRKGSTPPLPRKESKGIDALKLSGTKQQIKLTLKPTSNTTVKKIDRSAIAAGKKRGLESPPLIDSKAQVAAAAVKAAKKASSRREELLKQLKAVEDAIARKRSKV